MAVLLVGLITAVIYPLRDASASNGVLYLLGVLTVATIWGLRLGLLTSVASVAAFNYFYIPPVGRFTILAGRNAVALVVLLIAAVSASSLAGLARTRTWEAVLRRREADLAADMARLLLGGATVESALGVVARRLAEAFDLTSVNIELSTVVGDARRIALPLRDGETQFGTLLVPADAALPGVSLPDRVVPALEALLATALEREALQAEVVETRALRRSDEIKTALLRSISGPAPV